MKLYVASSWRNYVQAGCVHALRSLGHEVYDFRHPGPEHTGFHWKDIDPHWEKWTEAEYLLALRHPVAEASFATDFEAMQWADACLLVLPCGRSAHLEAGWMKAAGKRLFIMLGEEPVVPELMYKLADHVFPGYHSMLDFFSSERLPPLRAGLEKPT